MRKYKSGRLSAWVSLLFYSQAKNSFNPSNVWLYSTKELKVGHGFWLTIGKSIPSLCFMKKSYFLWLSTSVVDGCMFHTWVWIIKLQQLLIDWSEGSNSDCTSSNWNVKAWKIAQYRSCPPPLTEHYLLIRSCQTRHNHWSYRMVFCNYPFL